MRFDCSPDEGVQVVVPDYNGDNSGSYDYVDHDDYDDVSGMLMNKLGKGWNEFGLNNA